MAVTEREQIQRQPERAVFVASDGRRARRLRRAGFAAAFVACLWVVGLGVGMVGFGSLPGVSVVKEQIDEVAGGSGAPASESNRVSQSTQRPSTTRRVVDTSSSRPFRQPTRAPTRPVASRPARRPVAQAPAPPPAAQTPVNPATRTRGWARTGATAPRGQIRKTVTPPPPPGDRGQRRGQDPTAPPPVPPGQEKKAQTPLPPPPPPKKA